MIEKEKEMIVKKEFKNKSTSRNDIFSGLCFAINSQPVCRQNVKELMKTSVKAEKSI